MQNVAPSHALVRRSRQLLLLAFLTVSAGVFLAVIGIALNILPLAPLKNETVPTIGRIVFVFGGIVGLLGLIMAARAATWRTENDLALITGRSLEPHLDHRYTFIRNISKLGLGYIDAVLLGPQGALVFRILDDEGVFFNEASGWLKRNKNGGWSPWRVNPTKEAVVDIQRLRDYFKKRSLEDVPVYGVIVFTGDDSRAQISTERPTVPTTTLPHLLERLSDNYMAKERIDPRTVDALVKTLYEP